MAKTDKHFDIIDELVEEIGQAPTKMQDIPKYYQDKDFSVAFVVQNCMLMAKKYDLIPDKSPLRTIWYSFVKKSIENNGTLNKAPDKAFYRALSDLITKNDYYYEDFNIINSAILYKTNYSKGLDNYIVCLEKESYFGVMENLCELLGITLYAGGGQPSLSGSEYLFKRLNKKDNIINIEVVDFDPAGKNIRNTFSEQLGLYAARKGYTIESHLIGTSPEYYTSDELADGLYTVKLSDHSIWNNPKLKKLRDKFGIGKKEGLEVESLPADPTPIFNQLFPSFSLSSWKGQARMRLITLKKILGISGITKFMKNNLKSGFDNNYKARRIVRENSGYNELESLKSEIDAVIEEAIGEVINNASNSLYSEYNRVEEMLDEWRDEVIENEINDSDKTNEFTQKLIDAVASDKSYLSPKSFRIPSNIQNVSIKQSKLDKIREAKEKLEEVLKQIKEAFEIEDEDEDEDNDGENDSDEDSDEEFGDEVYDEDTCPECDGQDLDFDEYYDEDQDQTLYKTTCNECGHKFLTN